MCAASEDTTSGSPRVTPVSWRLLPRLPLPERHALLHAYLGDRLAAPQPGPEKLLGLPVRLGRLQLTRAPTRAPVEVDDPYGLCLFLGVTPPGAQAPGTVRLMLHGDLCQALLEPLLSYQETVRRPLAPITSEEAGLLAGLLAASLADLCPTPAVRIQDIRRADPAAPSLAPAPWLAGPEESPSWLLRCETYWSIGAIGGHASAWIDSRTAHALEQAAQAFPVPVTDARARGVPVVCQLLLAESRIPAQQAAELAPGDVVLFQDHPPADGAAIRVQLQSGLWRLDAILERTAEGRQLVVGATDRAQTSARPGTAAPAPGTAAPAAPITGARDNAGENVPAAPAAPATSARDNTGEQTRLERPMERSMPEPPVNPPSRPAASGAEVRFSPGQTKVLERLSVDLQVILGEVSLSAADVARLTPGAVVTLPQAVGDPVVIQSGGRPIAQGELVEVDGAMGVRILALHW